MKRRHIITGEQRSNMGGQYKSRRLVIKYTTTSFVALSGCLSAEDDSESNSPTDGTERSDPPTATEPPNQAVLDFEAVTLTEEQREWIEPIRFEELPDDEQSVVEGAMNLDRYAVDAPGPEPLQEFTSRANEHKSQQISAYRDEHGGADFPQYLDVVFLRRSEQSYATTLLVGDQVVSMADLLDQ